MTTWQDKLYEAFKVAMAEKAKLPAVDQIAVGPEGVLIWPTRIYLDTEYHPAGGWNLPEVLTRRPTADDFRIFNEEEDKRINAILAKHWQLDEDRCTKCGAELCEALDAYHGKDEELAGMCAPCRKKL